MECTDEECAEGANLRILPDKVSLRNNNVSSFFYAIRSMNSYWFNYNDTNSHMIKNDEWGAVAYLAQSKYGKYGNDDYEGVSTEVYINNSSGFYTGRSGGSYGGNTAINTVYTNQTSTTQYNTYGFYTYDGYLLSYDTNTKTDTRNMLKIASTTGNITGVYDMSGGLWEFVMGMFANSDGVKWAGYNQTHNSGFEGNAGTTPTNITGLGWPNKKYYNVYKAYSETNISSTTACDSKICYGHALSETSNWYGDYSNFVSISAPWFDRGGGSTIGKAAGLFSFDSYWGHANGRNSTRVVLTSN